MTSIDPESWNLGTSPTPADLLDLLGQRQAERQSELRRWWLDTCAADFDAAMAKATEYGSSDLVALGESLKRVAQGGLDNVPPAELACWFYAQGKIARLEADFSAGRPGKQDTWHDLTVYSLMARCIQERGGW